MGISVSEMIGNIEHEPTAFLKDDIGIHTTAVILVVEEVTDVQTKGEFVPFIFSTDVEDEASWYILMHHKSV